MFKKKSYKDFVELSVGKVYFKPIINKILTKVEILSQQTKGLNMALYYLLMERSIVVISRRKYDNLTIADSNKLRAKTKEILIREGIITEDDFQPKEGNDADLFSKQDTEWFEKQKQGHIR